MFFIDFLAKLTGKVSHLQSGYFSLNSVINRRALNVPLVVLFLLQPEVMPLSKSKFELVYRISSILAAYSIISLYQI